ncbi:MAG: COQ9 family protein [Paracoccaceae bacterium]
MTNDIRDKLLDGALAHVVFEGWGEPSLLAAAQDCGVSVDDARVAFPRPDVDMAAFYHGRGDAQMVARMQGQLFDALRYSERVGAAVRFRLEGADKELVRRGTTLFSLPQHAGKGAQLIWGTADAIWMALGDTSDDINWYSKRAILSGVYGSSVLFWLGDTTDGDAATWDFVERRIDDVMGFEKFKAKMRETPGISQLMDLSNSFLSGIKAPSGKQRNDLPGQWNT